jgi:hypothetical protein
MLLLRILVEWLEGLGVDESVILQCVLKKSNGGGHELDLCV